MPRMSTKEESLTIDCLNDGQLYTVWFSCPVEDGKHAQSDGSFTDEFVRLSIENDGQLYTVWDRQDRVDCRHITFIRIARHRD